LLLFYDSSLLISFNDVAEVLTHMLRHHSCWNKRNYDAISIIKFKNHNGETKQNKTKTIDPIAANP
jgi:hypothetical protein